MGDPHATTVTRGEHLVRGSTASRSISGERGVSYSCLLAASSRVASAAPHLLHLFHECTSACVQSVAEKQSLSLSCVQSLTKEQLLLSRNLLAKKPNAGHDGLGRLELAICQRLLDDEKALLNRHGCVLHRLLGESLKLQRWRWRRGDPARSQIHSNLADARTLKSSDPAARTPENGARGGGHFLRSKGRRKRRRVRWRWRGACPSSQCSRNWNLRL